MILQNGKLPEAVVLLGRDIEDRATTTSVGNALTPRVIRGILPYVKGTGPDWSANSAKSVLLCT